jgi:hypothetical protein
MCWNGNNQYLYRDKNQEKKFCKCAEGRYNYLADNYSLGKKTVYKYADQKDNENWETKSVTSYVSIYSVKCSDGNWYNTNKDYYYHTATITTTTTIITTTTATSTTILSTTSTQTTTTISTTTLTTTTQTTTSTISTITTTTTTTSTTSASTTSTQTTTTSTTSTTQPTSTCKEECISKGYHGGLCYSSYPGHGGCPQWFKDIGQSSCPTNNKCCCH